MSLTVEQFVTTGFGWSKPAETSQKNYRNHISQFERFLQSRNKTAKDGTVGDEDITDYIDALKSKYQPNTVAVKVAAIKSYFKWLRKTGSLTHCPYIRSQKSVKPEHKELDDAAVMSIIQNLRGESINKKRDLAMFSLIIFCGFKTEQVVAVNVEDIDFEECSIKVDNEKKNVKAAIHELLFYADAKEKMRATWTSQSTSDNKEPFFLNKNGHRITGRSLRRRIEDCMKGQYQMRDLRNTYLKNVERITEAVAV